MDRITWFTDVQLESQKETQQEEGGTPMLPNTKLNNIRRCFVRMEAYNTMMSPPLFLL